MVDNHLFDNEKSFHEILFLLFILFFSFSAIAVDCPVERPLQGNNSICYSCDEKDVVMVKTTQACSNICQNRYVSGFAKKGTSVP